MNKLTPDIAVLTHQGTNDLGIRRIFPRLDNGEYICRQCEKIGFVKTFSSHEAAIGHAVDYHSARVVDLLIKFSSEQRESVIYWCLRQRSDV